MENTRYELNDYGKKLNQKVTEEIINTLENYGGKFADNLEALPGQLYNAATGKPIDNKKTIQILTQMQVKDQRFMTANEARKENIPIHKNATKINVINYSAGAKVDSFKKEPVVLYGRTYGYYNAQDLDIGNRGKGDFTYTEEESKQLINNLAERMNEAYRNNNYHYKRDVENGNTNADKPEPVPTLENTSKEEYPSKIINYTVNNTVNMMKPYKKKEYVYGKESKPGEKRLTPPAEKRIRTQFVKNMSSLLLQAYVNTKSRTSLFHNIEEREARLLANRYKEHPEKLAKDLTKTKLTVETVKNKVLFMKRERLPLEEAKKMEKEFFSDSKNQGRKVPRNNYYRNVPISIPTIENKLFQKIRDSFVKLNAEMKAEQDRQNKILLNATNELKNRC